MAPACRITELRGPIALVSSTSPSGPASLHPPRLPPFRPHFRRAVEKIVRTEPLIRKLVPAPVTLDFRVIRVTNANQTITAPIARRIVTMPKRAVVPAAALATDNGVNARRGNMALIVPVAPRIVPRLPPALLAPSVRDEVLVPILSAAATAAMLAARASFSATSRLTVLVTVSANPTDRASAVRAMWDRTVQR